MLARKQPCESGSPLTNGASHAAAAANLVALDLGVLERQLDAGGHAQALGVRVGHVVRVAGHRACSSSSKHTERQ